MTDEHLLKAIYDILDSDTAFEETVAKPDGIVSRIYHIVHPRFSTCQHPDWEQTTSKL